jgi:predicted dienelactone hydrolase
VLPVFRFPNPGGPYNIGTVTYHWVDASRQEVFSADPSAPRELMVQIWYPEKNSSSPRAPYIQDADVVTLALLHNFPDFSLKHLKYVTTNAVESVPILDDKPSYLIL